MSEKPTSAADQTAALEFLERCGWSNSELIWEQIQEAAAGAWLANDRGEAVALWRGALEVSEEHFAPGDPRRVTSRINAVETEQCTAQVVVEAIESWRNCEDWVARLKPTIAARSSMFHLRLRSKHPGAYDRSGSEMLQALHRQGLEHLQRATEGGSFKERIERWHAEKPSGFNDYRKLLAAVLLIRYPG